MFRSIIWAITRCIAKSISARSKTPGVAVLHDAVLHHFFLGGENEEHYVAEFVYNYGHWSQDLARELWRQALAIGRGSGILPLSDDQADCGAVAVGDCA